MTKTNQKLTKDQRKNIAYKEYEKAREPAWKEYMKIDIPAWKKYQKKCDEIDNELVEVEEIKIIDGRKYKLVEELAK